MPRRSFKVFNGATAALTAAPVSVATGTSLKTMLQVKPTTPCVVTRWGFSFETVPTAVVKVELITTGTVNATVTQYAAGDVIKLSDPGGSASLATLATSGSGYTSSGEGTVTASRLLDFRNAWEQSYDIQLPLDREYTFDASNYLRVRMTTATTINAVCWVEWEE
jgi:hypothetical protein